MSSYRNQRAQSQFHLWEERDKEAVLRETQHANRAVLTGSLEILRGVLQVKHDGVVGRAFKSRKKKKKEVAFGELNWPEQRGTLSRRPLLPQEEGGTWLQLRQGWLLADRKASLLTPPTGQCSGLGGGCAEKA